MIKYTEQFKLAVTQQYLSGTLGYKRLAALHGTVAPVVRRWVAAYRVHGIDGLRRKIDRYDASFKRSVLQYMWDNALSNAQAAMAFNIRNPTTIGIWARRYREGGMEALAHPPRTGPRLPTMKSPSRPPPVKPDDQRTREELIKELEYLRMENVVLKKLEALAQAAKSGAPKKRK
jgi:transposase